MGNLEAGAFDDDVDNNNNNCNSVMKRYSDDCQLIYDIPCKIEPKFATYNMLLYAEKVIDGAHRRLCVKRGRIKSSAAFRTLLTLLAQQIDNEITS